MACSAVQLHPQAPVIFHGNKDLFSVVLHTVYFFGNAPKFSHLNFAQAQILSTSEETSGHPVLVGALSPQNNFHAYTIIPFGSPASAAPRSAAYFWGIAAQFVQSTHTRVNQTDNMYTSS